MIHIDNILKGVEAKDYSAFFYTPSIYANSLSYIFHSPFKILSAKNISEVEFCLNEVEIATRLGAVAFGIVNYECGFLFEKKLYTLLENKNETLISFHLFDEKNYQIINSREIQFNKWNNDSFSLKNFSLQTSFEKYSCDINKIKNYIAKGDTYQVNYTVKSNFNFDGSVTNLFKSLIFNQSAQYSSFINLGEKIILSLSPELFFETNGAQIKTRPMKGTVKRAYNKQSDEAAFRELSSSEKNKAENVMIVDLLRNDLGRISELGSVNVESLFEIEKYESLFQMTSSINSQLRNDVNLFEIFKNIFPCGSITGAPKIRTMEIINELESESRGIYTGSIGIVSKDKVNFNVAIRTIEINKADGTGELGVGSGIVWDSEPAKEYEETILKSKFLTSPNNYFELFETMLVENGELLFLNEHLDRLKQACEFFLFIFDESQIRNYCDKKLLSLGENKSYRLKLILTKWGEINCELEEYEPFNDKIKIIISDHQTFSNNPFVHFKTTNRKLYDEEYKRYRSNGYFDVIFMNEKMNITEGAITNIFIVKNSKWFTPKLSDGLLNGIYRSHIINQKEGVEEKSMQTEDLLSADMMYLTNSVRRLIKVDTLYSSNGIARTF